MKELRKEFEGTGEVKGFHFKQVYDGGNFYVYEVTDMTDVRLKHYEVFEKRVNKRFDCETYPRSINFGKWAWTTSTFEQALDCARRHGLISPSVEWSVEVTGIQQAV